MNYYRRFMGDYASKTADLSLAEHGAYTVLLDISYSTEKPLPGSYDALYRLCRAMTKAEQDAVKVVADRFFPLWDDGMRRNPRAADEIAKAQATIEKQRKSGADSASKRWSTDGSTNDSTDGLTDRSTHRSTDAVAIQPPTSNLQPPAANHQKKSAGRGSRLPADWEPGESEVAFCRENRPDLDPTLTASRFRDFWIAQAGSKGVKLDWQATWRNWVRNERKGQVSAPAGLRLAV